MRDLHFGGYMPATRNRVNYVLGLFFSYPDVPRGNLCMRGQKVRERTGSQQGSGDRLSGSLGGLGLEWKELELQRKIESGRVWEDELKAPL